MVASSAMDNVDKSQIGRYGTISLLKQQDPYTVITSFGIDTDELSFGRDHNCSIRLYYPDVDPVHCKIVFEERKAFLVVLGKHGLLVDDCLVYPNGVSLDAPITIPLTNNSKIEIHTKRFRFNYPPKELRAALFASPLRSNRAPRLSMIRSAQVFSPQPSQDPQENLRVLQSPLKGAFRSPLKPLCPSYSSSSSLSPTKSLNYAPQSNLMEDEEDEDDNDIVLVEGDHPRIIEEEKDLVILEDVKLPPTSIHHVTSPFPSSFGAPYLMQFPMSQPPQTPPRSRSNSRNSLHRAVLIRSAQRAILRTEKEKEDEMEEMEVLSAVASDDDFELNDEDEHERQLHPDEAAEQKDADNDVVMDVDWEGSESEMELRGRQTFSTIRRKNSEYIWQRDPSLEPERNEKLPIYTDHDCKTPKQNKRHVTSSWDSRSTQEEEKEESPSKDMLTDSYLKIRQFGAFMTPQPSRRLLQESRSSRRSLFYPQDNGNILESSENPDISESGSMRYSIGGGEPRRMLVEMPWRVRDLVVPLNAEQRRQTYSTSDSGDSTDHLHASAGTPHVARYNTPKPARKLVNEQEKKAIQERRRSALRQIDTFFIGGIPGMGVSPTKSATTQNKQCNDLPITPQQLVNISQENEQDMREHSAFLCLSSNHGTTNLKKEEEDDEVDTRSLLEKMRVTVEEMKRRRSTVLAPQPVSTTESPISVDEGQQKEDEWRKQVSGAGNATLKQEGLVVKQDIRTYVFQPEVIIDSPPEDDYDPAEKSFSQLMRTGSPEDVEKLSDDIRYILEQDIIIPSDSAIDHPGFLEYPDQQLIRSRSRTVSVEPEAVLSSLRRATNSSRIDHSDIDTDPAGDVRDDLDERSVGRGGTGLKTKSHGQEISVAGQMTTQAEVPEAESEKRADSEEEPEVTPMAETKLMSKAKRGHSLRTAPASGSSRRGRTMAPNKQQETSSNAGQESINAVNRQTRATATQINAPKGRGRPRKVKEEGPEMTADPAVTRSDRTGSATVAGGGSNTLAVAKTPVTRASSKKTPATAPSAIPVASTQDEREKENTRRSKTLPEEGTRVRVTRNRKATNTIATASKSTTAARIKDEGKEDNPPRRATRTRTRTKT